MRDSTVTASVNSSSDSPGPCPWVAVSQAASAPQPMAVAPTLNTNIAYQRGFNCAVLFARRNEAARP